MKHNYRIEKDEIMIRPVEEKDIEMIRNWRNIDSIRMSFLSQTIISAPQQKLWFEKYCNNDSDIMFIIEYHNLPVGTVALYNIDYHEKRAEFGRLMIGEMSARGKKIGEKVTSFLCEYAMSHLQLDKIVLEVYEDNIHAKVAYEAVGFKTIKYLSNNGRNVLLMEKARIEKNE